MVLRGFGLGGQSGSASADLGEDLLGWLLPDERLGVVFPVFDPTGTASPPSPRSHPREIRGAGFPGPSRREDRSSGRTPTPRWPCETCAYQRGPHRCPRSKRRIDRWCRCACSHGSSSRPDHASSVTTTECGPTPDTGSSRQRRTPPPARAVQVKADDIDELLLEVRVLRDLERLNVPRLESVVPPDPSDAVLADPVPSGHQPGQPTLTRAAQPSTT